MPILDPVGISKQCYPGGVIQVRGEQGKNFEIYKRRCILVGPNQTLLYKGTVFRGFLVIPLFRSRLLLA